MPEKVYSKEFQSVLIKTIVESPKLRIIDFFMDNPLSDFTKKEVIDALGINKQTFCKYFYSLEKYGMVKVSRTIGKAKLYKIDSGNELVKSIRDLEKKMSLQIVEQEEKLIPVE